ncbi:MAG: diguanylate cyclase [Acetobacterium sp.]
MNVDILEKVDEFMNVPLNINKTNQDFIKNDIIDFSDVRAREAFFVNVLGTQNSNIYSFSYGMETGEYYGARRNENYTIEIMRNNADTDFNSWYYGVTKDATASELVVKNGAFDPRTRDWYQAAKNSHVPIFSSVYKHFVLADLTISAAYPIYNKAGELEGVLGTHVTLSEINSFLRESVTAKNAAAVIIEKDSGALVANSFNQANFMVLEDGSVKRTAIGEINNFAILEAYENYRNTGATYDRVKTGNDQITVNLTEYKKQGLSWIIITAVPESIFTAGIFSSIQLTIILTVFSLIIASLIFYILTTMIFKPVDSLIDATEKFSDGDLLKRATIVRNDEIGRISVAFNAMADTIYSLVDRLEIKVTKRTRELEDSNDELKYLSYHDTLTGLYNRIYFEEALTRLDNEKNLPIAMIYGDVNGLKLTNDIFGHTAGDTLLKTISQIFKKVFRDEDIIARVGGDEFAILLTNTDADEAQVLIDQVKSNFSNESISALKGCISMGCDVKVFGPTDILDVLKNAEDFMYKEKTMNRKSINSGFIQSIIATHHKRNPREEVHAKNVSELSERIGRSMDLAEAQIKRVKEAGFLHDIGKIVLDNAVINHSRVLSEEEGKMVKEHAVIGYRVLNMFDETLDLAETVFAHHERWDGLGYPKGLKGEEIPLLARIIALAESYDTMIDPCIKPQQTREEAICEIKILSGKRFDPDIVRAFTELMEKDSNKK